MSKLVSTSNKKIYRVLIIFLLFSSVLNISTIANAEDRPDLVIDEDYIDQILPENIVEGENLLFVVMIKNQGVINVSASIKIGLALKIDGSIVATNSTKNGLPAGSSIFINLTWMPTFDDIGDHLLRVEVDYEEIILESNENNNIWDANIKVIERFTDLEIVNITPQNTIVVNQTAKIYSTIKNNGKNSLKPIFVKLISSEDGEV